MSPRYRLTDRTGRTIGYAYDRSTEIVGYLLLFLLALILAPFILIIGGLVTFWKWAVSVSITPFPNINGILVTIAVVVAVWILLISFRFVGRVLAQGAKASAEAGSITDLGISGLLHRVVIGGTLWGPYMICGFVLSGAVTALAFLIVWFVFMFVLGWLFSPSGSVVAVNVQPVVEIMETVAFGPIDIFASVIGGFYPYWAALAGLLGTCVSFFTRFLRPMGQASIRVRLLGILFWIGIGAIAPWIGMLLIRSYFVSSVIESSGQIQLNVSLLWWNLIGTLVGGSIFGVLTFPVAAIPPERL